MLKAGHVIAVEDTSTSPLVDHHLNSQSPHQSLLGIPLAVGDHKLGAAIIVYDTPHQFTPDELRRAEQAGNLVTLGLWVVQQDVELKRRLHESNALADIARSLSETERVGLDKVLQQIIDSAKDLIPSAEQAVIHLLDKENQLLIPRAVTGFKEPREGKLHMRLGEGVAGQVIADGMTINIPDVQNDQHFLRYETLPGFRSLMVSPVQTDKERLGTISIQSNRSNAFSTSEQQLLEFTGHSGCHCH